MHSDRLRTTANIELTEDIAVGQFENINLSAKKNSPAAPFGAFGQFWENSPHSIFPTFESTTLNITSKISLTSLKARLM